MRRSRRRTGNARSTGPVLCCVSLLFASIAVKAQPRPVELAIDAEIGASDNGNLARTGQETGDVSLTVRPRIIASLQGSRLEADLKAAAEIYTNTEGVQRTGRNPLSMELRGSFKAVLLEPGLTLDGEVQLRDTKTDAFAPTVQGSNNVERRTETLYRLSPELDLPLSPDSNLLARSNLSQVDNGAGAGARRNGHESLIRYESRPLPIGGSLELSRSDSDAPDLPDSRYSLTTVRARASMLASDELLLDATVGHDAVDTSGGGISQALYGIGARWTPGPRTFVDAGLERSYYGTGGRMSIKHRMPWMALSLRFSRKPGATPAVLSGESRPGNLQVLLDNVLTTRVPDPEQRQEQVVDLLDHRGFDPRLQDTTDQVAAYPQLQTRLEASVLLLGRRSSASLNLYAQTSQQLNAGFSLAGAAITADSRQRGGTVQITHLLTPQMSANVTMQWSKISGLAARMGDSSEQRNYRVTLQQQIAPRTNLVTGVERRLFSSTVASQSGFNENRVFVGISHRF